MVKWAFITVVLYILLVVLLVIPAAFGLADVVGGKGSNFLDFFELANYRQWQWWVVIGVIVLIQAMLLLYPVSRGKERPKPQRALWVSTVVAGILFSLLMLGVFASVAAAIWGDRAYNSPAAVIFWVVFIPVSWFLWAFLFYRFAKIMDADGFMARILKWLIGGSILELLVAVPCHVIVRHKDECCAHILTLYGIGTGLAVMALAFGPGIAFLFLKRAKSLKPDMTNSEQLTNMSIPSMNKFTLAKLAGAVILIVCLVWVMSVLSEFNNGFKKITQKQLDLENRVTNLEKRIPSGPNKIDEISIGKPFPNLQFKAVDGNNISVEQLRGKYVLIDFWATWCGPCKNEIPGLLELYEQYHSKGFEIIGITLDSDINVLKEFLAANHINWPQYCDGKTWDNAIASRFGINSIPSTILLNKDGIVIKRCLRGEKLKETIKELLNIN